MKKQHVGRLFDVIYNSRSRIFAVTKESKDDAKRLTSAVNSTREQIMTAVQESAKKACNLQVLLLLSLG